MSHAHGDGCRYEPDRSKLHKYRSYVVIYRCECCGMQVTRIPRKRSWRHPLG